MNIIVRCLAALLIAASCFAEESVHSITPAQADTIIEALVHYLGDYVSPETASTLQTYVAGHRSEYRAISDPKSLANKLTEDLRTVGHDHHLQVLFGEELGIQKEPTREEKQRAHAFDQANGYGIRSARRLPGNIGYLDLAYFSPDENAGQALAAAMQLVSGTDALIIDLRRNGGGSGGTATALLSRTQRRSTRRAAKVDHALRSGSALHGQAYLHSDQLPHALGCGIVRL